MDKLLHDSDTTVVMLLYTYTLCIVVSHNVKEVLTQLSQSWPQLQPATVCTTVNVFRCQRHSEVDTT